MIDIFAFWLLQIWILPIQIIVTQTLKWEDFQNYTEETGTLLMEIPGFEGIKLYISSEEKPLFVPFKFLPILCLHKFRIVLEF